MSHLWLNPQFLNTETREKVLKEILQYQPIWESRFSDSNPPPPGQSQRQLLRPVYWLGNWQFACLNYYHPPKGIEYRCVEGEKYGPELSQIVKRIEKDIHQKVPKKDIPSEWKLNTCLINYYGAKISENKLLDAARVGEHKDFEPGPVASLSFGERALFQFVKSRGRQQPSEVVLQQWLADNTLQVFAGPRYKEQLFHRVQRVEKKQPPKLPDIEISNFRTRRLNLTFRFVPDRHIKKISQFPTPLQKDLSPYLARLAMTSAYWKEQYSGLNA